MHFDSRINRAARMTVVWCWLHNYCELWNEVESYVTNVALRKDLVVGFVNARLLVHRKGE